MEKLFSYLKSTYHSVNVSSSTNARGDSLKKIILLSLLMLILTGCNEYLTYSGESDNWNGNYTTTINSDSGCENGNFLFHFKDKTKDIGLENIEVDIDRGPKLWEERFERNPISITTGSGCTIYNEDEGIRVTIKWDDDNEESFLLEKK